MSSIEEAIKQKHFESEQLRASINLMYTANWLYNKINGFLKPFNVTHEQFNVLRILKGSHPKYMCQKDILSRMISPNSNLTLIVKKLIAKQLITVEQSGVDKREYQINISRSGIALIKKINEELSKNKSELGQLNNSEFFHLNALLDKFRAH